MSGGPMSKSIITVVVDSELWDGSLAPGMLEAFPQSSPTAEPSIAGYFTLQETLEVNEHEGYPAYF
jgi:hypothetical protein